MNKYFKTVASAMVTFALLLSAVATPATAVAQSNFGFSDFGSGFGSNNPISESSDFGNDLSDEYEEAASESNSDESVSQEETQSASAGTDQNTTADDGSSASAESSSYTKCGFSAWGSTTINAGDDVRLDWETQGYHTVKINGETLSSNSGSKVYSNIQENTKYTLEAIRSNGTPCIAEVYINCLPPDTPKYCELDIHKTVNKHSAQVGEEITYTITIENIGDADCTGGGVKIYDEVDPNVIYKSNTVSSNLSAGYGNQPVYTSSDRTLRFNGHDLTPGESGTITWKGIIAEPAQCGDFEVTNQAKATAKELNNFKNWEYSETVKTDISNACVVKTPVCTLTPTNQTIKYGETATLSWTTDYATNVTITDFGTVDLDGSDTTVPLTANTSYTLTATGQGGEVTCRANVKVERDNPTPPNCPLTATDGRTIVEFSGLKLRTDQSINQAQTAVQTLDLDAGLYDITLVSWDGYNSRVTASQPNEQWRLEFINSGSVIGESGVIGDLEDNVREAIKTEKVNTDYSLTGNTTGIRAVHPFYPTTASPNSLYPICAAIDEKEVGMATVVAHKIVCTDEAELPNYSNINGPDMTANTAANWVANNPSCSLVEGWEFEWTDSQNNDPGDTATGKAGGPWSSFGPTNSSGQTSVEINLDTLTNDRVWFREVLQAGYIPFTHGQNAGTNVDDVTAEFYCNTDVQNYDNYDYIQGMEADQTYHCVAWNSPIPKVPAPTCDLFTATPGTITVGDTTTLTWETSNAVQVFLNNAVGEVNADDSIEVSPVETTTYKLTVVGAEDTSVDCEVPVTVSEDSVPVCEYFTATPNSLPVGGGDVTLDWKVTNGQTASITPAIGAVALTDSQVVNVTQGTTYVLTATDDNGDTVSCPAPVTVADPEPVFTCENNVNFSVSDSSILRGNDTTLTWSTTDVDTVSISNINATALSGNETVSPSSDTTYVLTATQGSKSVDCPVSVDVSSGGGGGGSSSPRCELEISDSRITLGDEITLTWDTSRATEVTLTDDEGEVLFTTGDYLADDKEEYFDGSITIEPTRDTQYTLLAERGSRDAECEVEVEIDDEIVVLETRDQQPLVAGISLTQVPYTGFEAGPFLTYMFYLLLIGWSLFITYLLVMRNSATAATIAAPVLFANRSDENKASMKKAEAIRPDVFTPSVMTKVVESQTVPANLPTGMQFAGQDVMKTAAVNPHQASDSDVTELENRAHEQKALLSSDSVRHFVATTAGSLERNEALDQVIAEAKKVYPLEDGWVVINEARMQNLCEVCKVNAQAQKETAFVPSTVPAGSGSLAEAIVTGNVVAAYEMIGNRPMFALADAAADLDSVYRNRKGANETVSDLLQAESAKFSDEQITQMISALTGALDGTYTDEAAAVKMAIMKAVKVAA